MRVKLRLAALLACLFCALALSSQALPQARHLPTGVELRRYTFEPTGEQLEYGVFLPGRIERNKPSPLVIALHGVGARPQAILGVLRDAAERHGYIMAAPMGYRLDGWYGYMGAEFRADPERVRIGAYSEQDVMNVLARMRAEFNIDDSRIYLVGASMGGAGVLYLAMKYPDYWAAIAPAAPGVLDEIPADLSSLRAVPIYIVHGDRDQAVPVARIRNWVSRMKDLGVPVRYREIPGGSHGTALPSGAEEIFRFFDDHARR